MSVVLSACVGAKQSADACDCPDDLVCADDGSCHTVCNTDSQCRPFEACEGGMCMDRDDHGNNGGDSGDDDGGDSGGEGDADGGDGEGGGDGDADDTGGDSDPPDPCGNGTPDAGELCDDGNDDPSDGCSDTCTINPGWTCFGAGPGSCVHTCGDGDLDLGESCDDGDFAAGDGCDDGCHEEEGWICTGVGPTSCEADCGDGLVRGPETCDDDNEDTDDGCDLCARQAGWLCLGEPSMCNRVLLVDDDAAGAGDGSSWADAFPSLDDALATAASGVETQIWIAAGRYVPSDTTNGFEVTAGIGLYGGFDGTSLDFGSRNPDPMTNGTELHGDVGGDDVPSDFTNRADNACVVVTTSGAATIDGLSIMHGGTCATLASGLINASGIPTLRGVHFIRNGGTGLYLGPSGTVVAEDILSYQSQNDGARFQVHTLTCRGCTFAANGGAGISAQREVRLIDGKVHDNQGGGILYVSDDHVSTSVGSLHLVNSQLVDNMNGAIYAICLGEDDIDIKLQGVLVADNTSASINGAGGITLWQFDTSLVTLLAQDSTFARNEPGASELLYVNGDAGTAFYASFINSILWDNGGPQVTSTSGVSDINATTCIVEGGMSGTGVMDVDPLLAADGTLLAGSPAIDAGDNDLIPLDGLDVDGDNDVSERLPRDIARSPRRQDDSTVTDTGNGTTPIVDLGAFER